MTKKLSKGQLNLHYTHSFYLDSYLATVVFYHIFYLTNESFSNEMMRQYNTISVKRRFEYAKSPVAIPVVRIFPSTSLKFSAYRAATG